MYKRQATITAACGSVTASTTVTVLAIPTEATTGGTVSSGTTSANSGQVITVTPSYVVLKPGATRTLSAKATPASVSYTHLDVYKRQPRLRPPRASPTSPATAVWPP